MERDNMDKPKKESSLFNISAAFFVISSSFSYIALGLAGVNVPRYYPELRVISIEPLADQISMGFYGKFIMALIVGIILTIGFAVFYPLLKKLELASLALTNKLMAGVVWFSVSLIVMEEWHKWGIEKRGLDAPTLFNTEMGLFLLGLLVFLLGILFTAAGISRVKTLNK